MNYLSEIIAFERWCETNYLPISSQLLWYKLMAISNKAGWSEWVTVDNLKLMAAMQMGREATLIKTRDELIKAGLVEYQKGKKGSPNKYKMVSLAEKYTFKNEVQSEVETVVENVAKNGVQSEVESVDIYKQKQNNKQKHNKKKDTSVSKEKSPPTHCDERFIPPTVDQVRDYCNERQNIIDPDYFVNYYSSLGWIGITDWKAKIRVWEFLDKQNQEKSVYTESKTCSAKSKQQNKFHNFEQRHTNYSDLLEQNMFNDPCCDDLS